MGRNVLISGASHGIGAATAIAFAKDGCNVGINYHNNRAGAEETAAECRKYGVDAQIYCADIGCREQAVGMMRDFIEHFGTVDVLINNAGGALKMPKGEFCDMPLDYWDSQIALNLSGAAYLSHEAIKNMKEHNIPGRIVNISSIHGSVTWVKRKALPYCAGKGGIPNLDFDFLPVGIDIRKVLKEGVCPAIHGGMFNRVGGLIGAGMARVPMQCFEKALVAFGEKYL